MNIYADRGNLLLLERRCEWRGIGFELTRERPRRAARSGRRTTSSTSAAARTATSACARRTCAEVKRDGAARAPPARGAALLARLRRLPAARPLLRARRRDAAGRRAASTCAPCASDGPRLIGNVAIEVDLGTDAGGRACSPASRTTAGARTSGRARSRSGACCAGTATTARAASRACGAGNAIGTYLHGPLLPKNVWFADWLIARALGPRRAAARRSTTRSRRPRTPRRGARRACEPARRCRPRRS